MGTVGSFLLLYIWPFHFSRFSSCYCFFGGSRLVSTLSVIQAWYGLVNLTFQSHGTTEEDLYGNRKLLKVHSQEESWEGQNPQ